MTYKHPPRPDYISIALGVSGCEDCPHYAECRICYANDPDATVVCERADEACGIDPEAPRQDYWLGQTHEELRPLDDPLWDMENEMPRQRLSAEELRAHRERWMGRTAE